MLERDVFPDDVDIEVGMHFGAEGPDGDVVPVWVTKIDGDQLTIDLNHPLAGKTLHFEVSIEAVRDATDEERTHGHPHEEGRKPADPGACGRAGTEVSSANSPKRA